VLNFIIGLWLLGGPSQTAQQTSADALQIFANGRTGKEFLASVVVQRERWIQNAARADVPRALVERLRRASAGLSLLIVAEDWCPDSVNTVPYVNRLAELAGVELRIVTRARSESLLERHPTPDGRTATPTIVLLRAGRDVAAWVERPAVLQEAFLKLRSDPRSAAEFAAKQSWYDGDLGRTTLEEIVALAERTAIRK
jgi:hypothetical protein